MPFVVLAQVGECPLFDAERAIRDGAFKITLTKGGHSVKSLAAGSYTFVIHDDSSIHSFALDGQHGFAKDFTTVRFKGKKTVTLKLKAGKYKYHCKAHEAGGPARP